MSPPTPQVPVDLAPPRTHGWLMLGSAAALTVALTGIDPGGRLLAWPVVGLLLGLGLRDLVLRPVLSLTDGGLVVALGWRRRAVSWPALVRARVVTDRRAPLLELDLGDTLVVLSRRRLGVPPYQALELLERARA